MHYIPDLPWSIIKSYLLTFNRNRSTKSSRAIKEYCVEYQNLLEDDEVNTFIDTSFVFIYCYGMMKHRSHWNYNYNLLPFTPLPPHDDDV